MSGYSSSTVNGRDNCKFTTTMIAHFQGTSCTIGE